MEEVCLTKSALIKSDSELVVMYTTCIACFGAKFSKIKWENEGNKAITVIVHTHIHTLTLYFFLRNSTRMATPPQIFALAQFYLASRTRKKVRRTHSKCPTLDLPKRRHVVMAPHVSSPVTSCQAHWARHGFDRNYCTSSGLSRCPSLHSVGQLQQLNQSLSCMALVIY